MENPKHEWARYKKWAEQDRTKAEIARAANRPDLALEYDREADYYTVLAVRMMMEGAC